MVLEQDDLIIAKIDLTFGFIAIRNDGILHTHLDLDMEVSIENTLLVNKKAHELTKGKAYPNLFTATNFMLPDLETRAFMVTEKRLSLTNADAMVLNSLPQRILANFYHKINKPPIPTKFFNNKNDAIQWLQQFV